MEDKKGIETMNNVRVFSNDRFNIRTVEDNGEFWFVAKDVCDALELSNPTMALESLDDDERAKFNLGRSPVHGGGGETNIISEPTFILATMVKLTAKSTPTGRRRAGCSFMN